MRPPNLRRARELLDRIGLGAWADDLPAVCSAGMRQSAALARTLLEDRPMVLMDEPFSALDAITRVRLQTLAAELLVGRTVLLVTHDPLEALRLGHDVHVMSGRPARRWLLPLLLIGLAIPVFAIAPLLVLWFGFGIAPKIIVVALITYFPVTAAFFDGLRRTDPGWLDLARVMNGSPCKALLHVRVPAAMPALASGLRIATALAPNAAIIGEWVGASSGLGYLMMHDNARTETARIFAALVVLAVFAVALYFTVDFALRRLIAWQAETLRSEE